MRINYNEKGQICLQLEDILNTLNEDDKIALLESLSCDEVIVKHVVDQILQGWTENGFYSSLGCYVDPHPLRGLDYAKRQFALLSDNLQKKEIERLQHALTKAEKELQEYRMEESIRHQRAHSL